MIRGLLFDMDGILVDTEKIHEQARRRIYTKYGIDYEKVKHIPVMGRNTEAIFNDVNQVCPFPCDLSGAIDEKREVFVSLLNAPIAPLPGVASLLKAYTGRMPIALVSASARKNIEAVMKNTGLGSFFSAFVYAEDVKRFKPDPDAFYLAAERIKQLPQHCVVFEDSNIGVTAARAAGARVVGVRTGHGHDTLEGADLIVDDLEVGEAAVKEFIENK